MLLLQNLATACEQLWANKLRSVLTVLGVIIAVASTLVVVAIVQGFSNYVTLFLQGLGTNAMWVFPVRPPGVSDRDRGRPELVRADVAEVVQSCAALSRIAPHLYREVKVKHQNREVKIKVMGTNPDFQYIRNFFVDVGRFFGPVEIDNRRPVCVLGRDALQQLQADEEIVGNHITIDGKRFHVLGLLERKGSFLGDSLDEIILIPYTTALEMYPEMERSMAFMAQAESPRQVPEATAQIVTALRRRHRLGPSQPNDFIVRTQDEVLQEFNKISSVASSVLFGIVGISLLVGGIGITNVMLVSVTERTREIGLRKALGARRRDILLQFLTEAVVLSTAGGIAGIGLAFGLTYLVALHPSMVDVVVPFWAVLVGVSFSMGVGVVFGLLPAFKAAIVQPIDALRYE